jgi:hypothetical protein
MAPEMYLDVFLIYDEEKSNEIQEEKAPREIQAELSIFF